MAAASKDAASPSSKNDDCEPLRDLDLDVEGITTVDRLNQEDGSEEKGHSLPSEKDLFNSNPDFEEEFIVLDSLNEEEIDFCSPNFNPSLALKSDKIIVPSPDIKTFKSLSSYEDAVKRRQSRATKTAKKDASSSYQSKSKAESKVDSRLLSLKHDKNLKSRHEKEGSSSKSRSNLQPTSCKGRGKVIIETKSERERQTSRSVTFKDPASTKNYLLQVN